MHEELKYEVEEVGYGNGDQASVLDVQDVEVEECVVVSCGG